MMRIIPFAALALLPALGHSQQLTGNATSDSAAVARAAYRRAAQATDPAVALREIGRSVTAWPAQPTYHWAMAMLSAGAGDTTAALNELDAYASLTLGRDLTAIKDLAWLNGLPRFAAIRAQHDINRAPIAASRVVHAVDDTTFWPEAVDYDATARAYYLSSVRRGTVMRIDANGRSTEFWAGDSLRSAVLGLRVDARRRSLWITTSGIPQRASFVPGDSAHSSILELSLDDGRVRRRFDLPVSRGGHVLGDLSIGPAGDVFVTDSHHPVLYRLRPDGGSLEATMHPLFYSLQGTAPSEDGRALYIADYSHGLLRMDLATGDVIRLPDAPRSTSIGCDGLTRYRESLICVQNGVAPARVARFRLAPSGLAIVAAEVIDRNSMIADEPTLGVMVGDEFVYVANSQWEKHDASGKRLPGLALRGPVLLGVRIK
jgi:sugar lactone lactonase YvrE